MRDSTIFDNQNIDEKIGDKVDSMDKCVESYLSEEPRRLSSEEPPSPVSSEQSDGTDGCIGCEEQYPTAAADNHHLKDVKIFGVHKQEMPRRSFFFVILVMKVDGSNLTVYRKRKELRKFQRNLRKLTKQDWLQADANYYLNKLRHKTSFSKTSSNGSMRRLRYIDSFNLYLQALVHYKQLHNHEIFKKFFSPTNDDFNFQQRIGGGKTYFYLTDSIVNTTPDLTFGDQPRHRDTDQSDSVSHSLSDSTNSENSASHHCSISSISPYVTSEHFLDNPASSKANDPLISSPMCGQMHVVLEGYDPSCDDDEHRHILSLKKGEKVEVLAKDVSGWWFARRFHGDDVEEETGYVPATYLQKSENTFEDFHSLSVKTQAAKAKIGRRFTDSPACIRRYLGMRTIGDFISIKSYTAKNSDELSFAENSVLTILQQDESGWWLGRYKGREGLVPGVHLRKYNDPLRRLSILMLMINVNV